MIWTSSMFTLFLLAVCLNGGSATTDEKVLVEKLSASSGSCRDGKTSRPSDTISYHYCGRLVNGKEFDCSFNYGQPYVFTIGTGQVISGMDTGLTGVCVGDALKVTIPSHLAYGTRGTSGIPPNSVLIFYVKVLSLERKDDDVGQSSTIKDMFSKGSRAYSEEDWVPAIKYLEKASSLFAQEESVRRNCSTGCIADDLISADRLREDLAEKGKCMRDCMTLGTGRSYRMQLSGYQRRQLRNREAYNFLLMAYFKVGEIEKAAAAAITYYHFNVDNPTALYNKKYFLSLDKVKGKPIALLETTSPHAPLFHKALDLYKEEKYADTASALEDVIALYSQALSTCWRNCYTVENGELPAASGDMNYDLSVAYKTVLRCQVNCSEQMENMGSYRYENLHSEIYHHLQFSYSQSGERDKGAAAMATAVLIRPTGLEVSLQFYQKQEDLAEHLHARKEAVAIVEKLAAMSRLLSDIDSWLPENPLENEGEVQEVTSDMETAGTRKGLDTNLFSKKQKPVGPPVVSLVP